MQSIGKQAVFTSLVFHVTLEDDTEWVLKTIKELSEIIGEVAAYKISELLQLGLVPETKFACYNGRIGSLQKYVGDTLPKGQYADLLSKQNENIELLKLFWFIAGQWDTSHDNVLFSREGKAVAIDNANIANIQKVSSYGKPPFVRCFYTDTENVGSIEYPLVLQGAASEVLKILGEQFNDELPVYLKVTLTKQKEQQTSFIYFVADHRVWRDFGGNKAELGYFMKTFSLEAL